MRVKNQEKNNIRVFPRSFDEENSL